MLLVDKSDVTRLIRNMIISVPEAGYTALLWPDIRPSPLTLSFIPTIVPLALFVAIFSTKKQQHHFQLDRELTN